jgi:hypothetical protein
MKRFIRPATILIASLLLLLFSVAFSKSISAQPAKFGNNTRAALFFQITFDDAAGSAWPRPGDTGVRVGAFQQASLNYARG